MKMDLRTYLQQNHNKLTWKERIEIARYIINAVYRIHKEDAIHRDLHSGNVLYKHTDRRFFISDLGFCGPADKPLNSVYGNLPYMAPEVITEKKNTFASDIYSVGMLMWEISSGKPPFVNYEHDYYLAMKIVNGMRPKIVSGTPLKYKELMEQCWDADVIKRSDISKLKDEIKELLLYFQNDQTENNEQIMSSQYQQSNSTNSISKICTSKTYQFDNFSEPKNATEGNIYINICIINMLTINYTHFFILISTEEQEGK